MVTITNDPVPVKLTPKQKCEGRGGFWDEETQTCRTSQEIDQGTAQEKAPTTQRELETRRTEQQAIRDTEARAKRKAAAAAANAALDTPVGTTIQDKEPTQPDNSNLRS